MRFCHGKQRHKEKLFRSTIIYVIVAVTCQENNSLYIFYVCNVFVDNGTMPTGINTLGIPGDFLTYMCVRIELKFAHREMFHVCVSYLLQDKLLQKSARYVYLVQTQWCSELFFQVLKSV